MDASKLGLYILRGRLAVPTDDPIEWAKALQDRTKIIAAEEIGGLLVSTVFLGIDHSFGDGPPLIFETMVFEGDNSTGYCDRCGTWEEAIEMHERAVAHTIAKEPQP